MKKQKSIVDFLVANNEEKNSNFVKLEAFPRSILNDETSLRYKYASASQSISAINYFGQKFMSGEINSANCELYADDIAYGMRLQLFELGKTPGLFRAFLWTKRVAVKDLLITFNLALNGMNIISTMVLIRPVLEQIAAIVKFRSEINSLFDVEEEQNKDMSSRLITFSEITHIYGKSTKIDWETYASKSLREGKKKSYKPEPGTVDVTASDLMNNIDWLNKSVKGARKAYELASEFAHPNVGPHNMLIQSITNVTLDDGIILWDRISDCSLPTQGINMWRDRLNELVEIVVESIELFQEIVKELEGKQEIVNGWSKVTIRSGIKNHPLLFHLQEPCPCFSGSKFGRCCGKDVVKTHRKHFKKHQIKQ